MRLTAVIADDEPLARRKLRRMLEVEDDVQVVAECGSGREAIAAVRDTDPDLLFLDIEMPERNGLEVVREIRAERRRRMPAVVFVTAHCEYALKAFEVQAVDYLLKPFDRSRFATALAAARGRLEPAGGEGTAERGAAGAELDHRLLRLLEGMPREAPRHPARLTVRRARRIHFLEVKDVEWIDAAANYVRLNTPQGSYLLRDTMASLELRLDPERFLRIHRSTIVNVDQVQEIQPLAHGEYAIILKRGQRLTLSRTYRSQLDRLLGR